MGIRVDQHLNPPVDQHQPRLTNTPAGTLSTAPAWPSRLAFAPYGPDIETRPHTRARASADSPDRRRPPANRMPDMGLTWCPRRLKHLVGSDPDTQDTVGTGDHLRRRRARIRGERINGLADPAADWLV
jgi:hypothetical protein